MCVQKVFGRSQTEKLRVSQKRQLKMERMVVYNLGCLKGAFESFKRNEDKVEKGDETHLVSNLDEEKTFEFFAGIYVSSVHLSFRVANKSK